MLAPPWRRVAATLFDVIITLVVFGSLFNFNISSQYFPTHSVYQLVHPKNAIINLCAIVAYFTLFEGAFGATLGKWLFRERVVDTHAGKIGFGRALVRSLVKPLDIFTIGLPLLLLSPRNQSIGDRLAGTVVARSDSLHGMSEVAAAAITPLRRVVAFCLLALALWTIGLSVRGWTNVYQVTKVAQRSIDLMRQGYRMGTMEALYSSGSDELRRHQTLAQFQSTFLNMPAQLAFTSLGTLTFSRWTFQGRLAAADALDDSGNTCSVVLVRDPSGWKFQALRLGSQD
jgi:uncharacterized RDD family membrane protein YckC